MSAKYLSSDTLYNWISAAQQSSRGRQHLNLHENYSDKMQRLLNSIDTESYIRPHRHLIDQKPELLVAVSGTFSLLVFNDPGGLKMLLCSGTTGVIVTVLQLS